MIKEQIKDGYKNGQDKEKHKTHRIKEHITCGHDDIKHMTHRMRERNPNGLCQALYCHVHPGYVFYVYPMCSMLYFVLSIRVAFPHPMCHMFYIVMPIADLLGYSLHVSFVLF
jgi:hypothetical protein